MVLTHRLVPLAFWHTLQHTVKHRLQHRWQMKVLENKLRRMAERQGYVLEKSKRRDPKATDFGKYRLLVNHRDIDEHRANTGFDQTLGEIEGFLSSMEDD
jgi:hypothetical protein